MSGQSFAGWLRDQHQSPRWYSQLAQAARRDPAFPKQGDITAVHARLITMGADGDAFEQLDDAAREWPGRAN